MGANDENVVEKVVEIELLNLQFYFLTFKENFIMKEQKFNNLDSVIETKDHFQSGAGSKSRTNRENFFRIMCFSLLAAVFILSGCDKIDKDEDEVYLLVEINKDNGWRLTKFEYDDQNCITKITANYSDTHSEIIALSYNGTGNLTSMNWNDSTYTFTKEGSKITVNRSWWEDDDGENSESIDLNVAGLIEKWTYNRTYDNGDWYINIYTYEYQAGNMSKITYTKESEWGGASDSYSQIFTFTTYDEKRSPSYRCKTPQWWFWWHLEGMQIFGSRNNIKIANWGNEDGVSTFEYTYNDNWFPVTMKEKKSNGYESTSTFKYEKK